MNSKVARVIDEYGLDGFGDELVDRWLGENGESESLRSLSDEFNRQVLRSAMEREGVNLLDGDVENTYRLLTDNDVTGGMRTEAERALERDGIDVDELRQDFVSHQAVHTYLTKHREVSKKRETDESQLEKGSRTIQQLKGRTQAVTQNIVDNLRKTGRLPVDEAEVIVDVRVLETETGRTHDVIDMIERERRREEAESESESESVA